MEAAFWGGSPVQPLGRLPLSVRRRCSAALGRTAGIGCGLRASAPHLRGPGLAPTREAWVSGRPSGGSAPVDSISFPLGLSQAAISCALSARVVGLLWRCRGGGCRADRHLFPGTGVRSPSSGRPACPGPNGSVKWGMHNGSGSCARICHASFLPVAKVWMCNV